MNINEIGFGVLDFYRQAFERDFSRNFQLRVLNIGQLIGPEDNVLIRTAELPDYAIQNITVNFVGMTFNIPGAGNFPGSGNWNVTFLCDLNFDIRGKLERWQRVIFNAVEDPNIPNAPPGSTGVYNIPSLDQTVRLMLHDRTGDIYRIYTLVGCYPTNIGTLRYDQSGNGSVIEMTATLAYQWWILEMAGWPKHNSLQTYGL